MRLACAGALALLFLGVLASARDSAFRATRREARTGSSQQTLGPVEGIAQAIAGVAAAITGNAGVSDESEAQHEAKAAQDEVSMPDPVPADAPECSRLGPATRAASALLCPL